MEIYPLHNPPNLSKSWFRHLLDAFLHLAFPHICEGCGTDTLGRHHYLCLHCLEALPATNYHLYADNPVEKMFWGRLPLTVASAQYYFTQESRMQYLVYQFKYRRHRALGHYLGCLMGEALAAGGRFSSVDALVPLPLHPAKERDRGFNQASVLCDGIAAVLQKPVLRDAVRRTEHTESQTKKNRIERWQNMQGRFEVLRPEAIAGKHILLVDDVVTTGATLEACGRALAGAPDVQLSLATLCVSAH